MKKIPTIFKRNMDKQPAYVVDETLVNVSRALATRKYDGTCALVRDSKLYKRREVRKEKPVPQDFELVDEDANTGKKFGWVPVGDGPEDKWFRDIPIPEVDGTYELIGPKVQGNPEGVSGHCFVLHGENVLDGVPSDYNGLKQWLSEACVEGIVWWKDGKPVGKIKGKDFGIKRL